VGQILQVELWANRSHEFNDGLATVYADLTYDPRRVAVLDIVPSDLFGNFAGGALDSTSGVIRGLGGATEPGDSMVGIEPAWALVATVEIQIVRDTGFNVSTSPATDTFGVSAFGKFGNIEPARVSYGSLGLMMPATFQERPELDRNTVDRDKVQN
jgi:hypothetical protein